VADAGAARRPSCLADKAVTCGNPNQDWSSTAVNAGSTGRDPGRASGVKTPMPDKNPAGQKAPRTRTEKARLPQTCGPRAFGRHLAN